MYVSKHGQKFIKKQVTPFPKVFLCNM